MSRVLLDTSAYSTMHKGDERLLAPIQEASEVFLTSIVVGELLFGFRTGAQGKRNRGLLRAFIESPRVAVIPVDQETAERYSVIRDHLRQQGTPVPANDLWIAASAAQHGLRLLTLDAHFKRIPQAHVDYFEPYS